LYIQYLGFELAAGSRTYAFHVIAESEETREFTVDLQSEAFRSPPLRTQDGPGICYARLKQELERETKESRVGTHLQIGERDIQEYIERHYPHKPSDKWRAGAKS
jgi:hypothetical protein